MKDLLKTLVELPTTPNNIAVNNEALDFVDRYLSERGMHSARFEWNDRASLVATTRKDVIEPTVMFVLHLDVMVGEDDLFSLREENGKFFGRGVFDMKFAIAACMQMVDDLKGQLENYDFGIMITTDEEGMSAGADGVKKLVEHGYRAKVCVVPDGGYGWQIETFAKGIWRCILQVKGVSGHGSRPWEADSASYKLVALLEEVKALFSDQGPTTDTLNIGIIRAGEIVNQIPGEAQVEMDVRFVSYESLDGKLDKLRQLCKKYDTNIIFEAAGALCRNDINNPYISTFIRCIETITGETVNETMSYGATDARYFSAVGVPCVIVTPRGGGHHSSKEWIDVEGFYQFKDVLREYLDQVHTTNITVIGKGPQELLTVTH